MGYREILYIKQGQRNNLSMSFFSSFLTAIIITVSRTAKTNTDIIIVSVLIIPQDNKPKVSAN